MFRDPTKKTSSLSRHNPELMNTQTESETLFIKEEVKLISCTYQKKPLIHEWGCKKVTPEAGNSLRNIERLI